MIPEAAVEGNERMTITEFLEARIAEDERLAEAAIETEAPDKWENPTETLNQWPANIAFWGSQTPHRLLAECAAKRAITKAHSNITIWPEGTGGAKYYTGSKEVCASCDERTQTPCPTIRTIAAIYKDHPDYQQEWAE